jgi:hypothetical protein
MSLGMWINLKKYLNVQFAMLYRYVLPVKHFADPRFAPTVLSSFRLVRGEDFAWYFATNRRSAYGQRLEPLTLWRIL